MAGNPFAELDCKQDELAVAAEQSQGRRSVFVFDCEAVPDERLYPRPEEEPLPVRESKPDREDVDLDDFMAGTVDQIKKEVEGEGFSDRQLNQLLDIENARKKPRKGVRDAIDAALNAGEKELQDVRESNEEAFANWRKEGSVNPLKARIVAFGWAFLGGKVQSLVATNDDEERIILEKFWELHMQCVRRCGYNIHQYDDLLLVNRSMKLGVTIPMRLDRRKYNNPQAIDLFVQLYPSMPKKGADGSGKTAKEIAPLLGPIGEEIQPLVDTKGEDVFGLYESGNMDAIAEYVRSDVHVEREMYLYLSEGFKF